MNKQLLRPLKNFFVKYSAEILVGLGITGMITGAIMVGTATPKAISRVEEKKKETGKEKLTPLETVQATWKCYIPAVATEAVSAACIIGANSINTRRNAALGMAYSLSETAMRTYQEKVTEKVGEKKEQEIRDSIAKDKMDEICSGPDREVIFTGHGDTHCLDLITGREFTSDINFIQMKINELNRTMRDECYVSLNEFYSAIDLDEIDPRVGDELGWNINKGYIDISLSSQLNKKGIPCLVISFVLAPKYGYRGY